jgi:hypothetical protein
MKRGVLNLLDPSNDPEIFFRLYRNHPGYKNQVILEPIIN